MVVFVDFVFLVDSLSMIERVGVHVRAAGVHVRDAGVHVRDAGVHVRDLV